MLDVKILPTSLQILAHVPLSPAPRTPHPIDLGILPTPNVILAHPRLIRLNRLPIHRPHLSPGLSRRETRSLRDVPKTQGRIGAATTSEDEDVCAISLSVTRARGRDVERRRTHPETSARPSGLAPRLNTQLE